MDSGSGSSRSDQYQLHLPLDTPFDLDLISSNYEGRAQINRLLYIASICPSLKGAALSQALDTLVQDTLDTNVYEAVYHAYRQHLNQFTTPSETIDDFAMSWYQTKVVNGDGEKAFDRTWVEKSKKEAAVGLDRLETELKGYTTNLIKESIRMAHRDLARFLFKTGDMAGAIKSHTKSREFCTSSQNVLEMCMGAIEVALELNNYSLMKNYILKAETALEALATAPSNSPSKAKTKAAPANQSMPGMVAPAQDPIEAAKIKTRSVQKERLTVAGAVAWLGMGTYERCARDLTSVGKETLSSGENHFIPSADIALYAVLTGLATFTRSELKSRLLENQDLRPMLDLEPGLKGITRDFYEGRYKEGLAGLEKYSARQILDIHLQPHRHVLINMILRRSLLTYFSPYSIVDLPTMAAAFGFSTVQLQHHLIPLIAGNMLRGRIDKIGDRIVAKDSGAQGRGKAYERAFKEGEILRKREVASAFRMRLIQSDILVKGKGQANVLESYV